jgi:phage terminase large subunit-like protein
MIVAAPATNAVRQQLEQYVDDVLAGEIVAGRLVRLACERHRRDLEQSSVTGYWFDDDAAERAVEFFAFCRHVKGELARRPIVLDDWQVFVVGSLFGWKRSDNLRRFRRAYLSVARKNGKTTLAAGLALYLAFFDHEPGAEVFAAALTADQAKSVCWGIAAQMVRYSSLLQRRITPLANRLIRDDNASMFAPIAHVADAHEGRNPHAAIIDEYHAYPTSELPDVLELGTGARRQPLLIYTTTAGTGTESPCLALDTDCVAILEQIVDDDTTFAYIARLDHASEAFDERCWAKANPCLGVSVKVDSMRAGAAVARRRPRDLNEFLRKRCNLWTQAAERWLSLDDWDACGDEPDIAAGQTAFLGLDLSSTVDLTAALLVVKQPDGTYDVTGRYYRPEDTVADAEERDRVPYQRWSDEGRLVLMPGTMLDPAAIADDVLDWIDDLGVDVAEIGFDSWNAASAAARLEAAGASIVALAQGYKTYTEPCHALEGLLASRLLRHGNDPVLRWMAGQVTVRLGPNKSLRPFKPAGSQIRDDGIVALLMALSRALVYQRRPATSWSFWSLDDVTG